MRDMPSQRSILLFILLIVGISILLFNDFGKSRSLVIDSILDFGHVPLFCFVTAMVLWLLEWRRWPMTTTRNYILAGALSGGLAILTEVLQQLTPDRSFQVGDIIHDLIGSAVFLLFAYQYKRNLQKRNQLIMIILAGVLLIIAGIPVLATSIEELRSREEFPLLASFETWTEMKRWKRPSEKSWIIYAGKRGFPREPTMNRGRNSTPLQPWYLVNRSGNVNPAQSGPYW